MIETPDNYRKTLADAGGVNQYGEPMFQLVWGSQPVPRKSGFPQMFVTPIEFLAAYRDYWVLMKWKPPEEFGDPEDWPFPTEYGCYFPMLQFQQEIDDEKGKTKRVPAMLDSDMLNIPALQCYVWVVLNHERDSLAERVRVMKDEQARTKAAEDQRLIELIESGAPAFAGACSFTGQLNVNSVIKQKMEELERNWDRISNTAMHFPRRGGMLQAAAR